MAVSFGENQRGDETGSVCSSIPPPTIRAVIPKLLVEERVAGRLAVSTRLTL
jgi:hypothetical protein